MNSVLVMTDQPASCPSISKRSCIESEGVLLHQILCAQQTFLGNLLHSHDYSLSGMSLIDMCQLCRVAPNSSRYMLLADCWSGGPGQSGSTVCTGLRSPAVCHQPTHGQGNSWQDRGQSAVYLCLHCPHQGTGMSSDQLLFVPIGP